MHNVSLWQARLVNGNHSNAARVNECVEQEPEQIRRLYLLLMGTDCQRGKCENGQKRAGVRALSPIPFHLRMRKLRLFFYYPY
jgi:hypothetical protein